MNVQELISAKLRIMLDEMDFMDLNHDIRPQGTGYECAESVLGKAWDFARGNSHHRPK